MRKLIAAVLLFAAASASAQWREAFNASTLYWENDNFGVGRKSDRFYTNGVRYSLVLSNTATQWQWPEKLRDAVWSRWGLATARPVYSVGLVFGQNLYTPQIITIVAPQPLDRPWAGVLYGGLTETITDPDQRLSHTFEIHAGVLGQGAGGQRTQKFVHNTAGFSNNDPQGWPNQLRNEPTLTLVYQQARRYSIREEVADITPTFGALVGSPQTNLNAGATLRLGYHVSGMAAGSISGTVPLAQLKEPHAFEAYVFAGAEARFVPFNATLDGGLFNDGPAAPGPKRFVNDVRAGLSVRWRWTRVTYAVVDRSQEFDVPPGAVRRQRFGSIALTIEPFDRFR